MSQIRDWNHLNSKVLERNRLLERLTANRTKKLILITGFPSQGKSTLALQYIQHCGADYFWIELDVTDSVPLYFCQTILAAAEKSLSLNDQKKLKDSLVEIDKTSPLTIAHYQRWVMTLMRKIEHPVDIVFDNLDKLNKNTKTLRIIECLVSSVPENTQLILISRWFPQLKLQKYIINGLAALLTDADLRLGAEEFKIFWRSYFGRSLSREKARRMYAKTNGWIGALVLIADGLNSQIRDSHEAYFDKILRVDLPEGSFLYFQQEAFESLSDAHQKFLCKIASLRQIYPSDIREIFKNEWVGSLVDQTLSMNLFLDKCTDSDKQRYYRFHPFYRAFLLKKQKQYLSSSQRQRINLMAARFYEKAQRYEIAIELYLKAGRKRIGRSLIEELGVKMLKEHRFSVIANWISYFDDQEIRDDHLLYFLRFISQPHEGFERGNCLPVQFMVEFFSNAQFEDALTYMGLTLESIFLTGKQYQSAGYLLQQACNLLTSSEVNRYPEACARLWLQIGSVAIYATGEIVKGIVACETARRLGQLIEGRLIEAEAAAITSIGNALLGRISEAKKSYNLFKKLFSGQDSRLKCIGIVGECVINLLADEPINFGDRVHQLVAALEEGHMWCLEFHVTLLKAVRMITLEQYADAEELMDSLNNLLHPLPNPIWEFHLSFFKARLKYLQNDLDSARQLITQTIHTKLDIIKSDGIHYAHANLLAGIIDFNHGSILTSREYLQKAMVVFNDLGATISKCEATLILGALEVTSDQTTAGKKKLKFGIDLFIQKKVSNFVVLRPADVALLVCIALENEVLGAIDCAQMLVKKRRYRSAIKDLLKNRAAGYKPSLQNTIKDINKSIYRAGLQKIYITTLGGFCVRRGELVLNERQWGGSQPINMLKVILSKDCNNVSKYFLMEELWPKLAPSAMERAFKIALHRLRKSLEPTMLRSYGSSYIHFRNNLISIDSDMVIIDYFEYINAIKYANKLSAKGEFDKALAVHRKADQIYAGQFLPGDQYTPWASEKRESLKNIRIEQFFEIARIQEWRNQKKLAIKAYEKVLLYDPFEESALQKLMIHCKALDFTAKAIKAFCNFELILEKELNLMPAKATQELYQHIVSKKITEVL